MSSTPPHPEPEAAPSPGASRSPVLIGSLVGVLVFVVAGAGFAAWKWYDDRDSDPAAAPTTQPSATPSPTPTAEASNGPGSDDPRLAKFYEQKLDWRDCGGNTCATMKVPLDYDRPGARSIDIAVLRVKANGKKLGSLVVNPGGPGGSGISYAAAASLQFGSVLTDRYDIVGFDPRGVGQSTPLDCIDTEDLDELVMYDPDPDTAAERAEYDSLITGFGQGCLDSDAALARHVSTVEAAKDMDILRAVLGEKKLDYLGASYGTFLGATYADLFPQNVDRMVLDGAVDPSLSNKELSLAQARGFETALRAYVKDCVDQGNCFLGDSVDEGTQRIRAFFDEVEENPLPTDDDRELTAGLAMIGVWLPLYVKEYWPQLSAALQQAMDDGRGSALQTLADVYLSRGEDDYSDNSMQALYAVNCLDHSDSIPISEVPAHQAEFLKASPTFGEAFAFALSTCSAWPVKSGSVTKALDAAGAPPILVLGTTRDPATPLEWSEALASQLSSGVLIVRDGDGHTAFQRGNDCVDSAVEEFFTVGTVPKDGLRC